MPEEHPPQPKPTDGLKNLRTYQSDVEEMMRKKEVSKATIALAENEREIKKEAVVAEPEPVPVPPASPSKVFSISSGLPLRAHWNLRLILLIVLGVAVIVGVGIGVVFFYTEPKPTTAPPKKEAPQTRAIALSGSERRVGAFTAIQSGLQAISIPQNEIKAVPLIYGGTAITTLQLFDMLEANVPGVLVRALGDIPVLGLHGFQGGQPFLLFGVSSYDFAFAGMLKWEETLIQSIGPLFGVNERDILLRVGSTTDEALQNRIVFKDVVIRNKDARAAFNPKGVIVFIYSFIDKETLILTTNEDTAKALVSKSGGGKLR